MQNNNQPPHDEKLVVSPREQMSNNLIIPVTPDQPIDKKDPPDIKLEREAAKKARLKLTY